LWAIELNVVVKVMNGWATTASPQSKNLSPSDPTTMLPPWMSSCWIEAATPPAASSAGQRPHRRQDLSEAFSSASAAPAPRP